ncbi:hypothetical protein [Mangrovivirga cuniculi]|uniref:Uncharacterized protein n=1 Tax=Mangrovivirga cuniculi TaxID=2715131 RepID=A0A4D7JM29_9BACT|nr:hypothetical protein [Mangrovivirga cuniculi]QCK16641.1 hypothetical protein DCC35_18845 [Mangrovivirga cuniculi]
MKSITKMFTVVLLTSIFISCSEESREKVSEASETISNVTKMASKAEEAKEKSDELKTLTPLTNDQLKQWLPESLSGMDRTGFKVGKAGYMNISSIEGTFKSEADDRELKVEVMDGAGEVGSSLLMGMNMVANMDREEEDERKHLKTVTVDGQKALQTYYKKRDVTHLQFVYNDRFSVMVKASKTKPDQAWDLVDKLDFESLSDMAE